MTSAPRPVDSGGVGDTLDAQLALRIEGLSKTFPGQRALNDLSIQIRAGEIHGLVGQNGSGKSTLIKILSGFHKADGGAQVEVDGVETDLGSPDRLHAMRFVHQDLALVPTLTVQENLHIAHTGRGMLAPLRPRRERGTTRSLLQTFGVEIDPTTLVGRLTPFEKTAVAIVRALGDVDRGVSLLVLDEPTASLGALESEQLFAAVRRINADTGVAVLYVSHFLEEVLSITDRITVLRDGSRVVTVTAADTSRSELIRHILGHDAELVEPSPVTASDHEAMLVVTDLHGLNLEKTSFSVRPGEIVGVTGVAGSGYERIAEFLGGEIVSNGGVVSVGGAPLAGLDPRSTQSAGMAAVPADRRVLGLIAQFTLAENLVLPDITRNWRGGRINRRSEEAEVRVWLEEVGVVPPDPTKRVDQLSGGNQQKVMIAKALRLDPTVLVVAEPTQAVDVGAAASIRKLLISLAEAGKALLVSGSDPAELEEICHRVLVVRNGRVACELVGAEITQERITHESQFEGDHP